MDDAQMQGAKMNGAQMQGATMDHAQMQGAKMNRAQMQGATMNNAQMQGATMNYAQMQDATMNSAQMQGARIVMSTPSVLRRVRELMRSAKRFSGTQKTSVPKPILHEPRIIFLGWPLTGFFH